ncbi:putative spermidine/putrescine transport system ATP-binding protein [Murinocardiopsis flavida]|uniref:Putative spermidine/putrescine transport system ATP-binding protein n=1 Tax=Murinocardiopsis flavida TaxID=645275 RepID=A0A2P8DUK9_9ACTN|nr:ABC transporter ATP-binding protein [Murinocardiopsis flavida]PSL00901.1 putative spermidine/putrescine transport system ATP-binding protein [Murinocardiopsis flavida]
MTEKTLGGELSLTDVRRSYGGQRGVDSVSLDVRSGEFLTMLGPSGSGKTTTLNLIAGFLDTDSGSITLDGRELAGIPAHRRELGVVFQQYALFPHMTAAQNIAYPLRVRGVKGAEQRRLVAEALDLVHLAEYGDRTPAQLSGGQQQRVALARAIVFRPRLLLMDEPLGALDKKLREAMQIEITRICRELGATVIYVTHDQEEALAMSDRIAIYNAGRIEQLGTAEELYERPASLFVADFVGESTVLHGTYSAGALAFGGARLTAAAAGTAPADGTAAALVLRPENVAVYPASAEGDVPEGHNRVRATVEEWIYLGVAKKCLLACSDGTVVTARTATTVDEGPLGPGAEAVVAWDPEKSVVVPDHRETAAANQ